LRENERRRNGREREQPRKYLAGGKLQLFKSVEGDRKIGNKIMGVMYTRRGRGTKPGEGEG